MQKIVVSLGQEDVLALQEILLDRSAEDALAFLEERVAPKIPRAGTALCDSSRLNPYLFRNDNEEPEGDKPEITDADGDK